MPNSIRFTLILAICLLLAPPLRAQPENAVYYRVPLSSLKVTQGVIPALSPAPRFSDPARQPRIVLNGGGVALISYALQQDMPAMPVSLRDADLLIALPRAAEDVEGTLLILDRDRAGMDQIRFTANLKGSIASKRDFQGALLEWYRLWADRDIAGAAWFRYQARAISADLGEAAPRDNPAQNFPRRPSPNPLDDSFALFGGGRAVSENLQLDRALPAANQADDATVPLSDIVGITVQEMDWNARIKDLKPQLDPLAAMIPSDQHAIFFPSFEAMSRLIDRANRQGSLLVSSAGPRSEDAGIQQRYERQLCLSLTGLGRLLGPRVISSVAITGSDPYLVTGTDIAVLFEARSIDALAPLITAQIALGRQMSADAKPVSGNIDGIAYSGALSPDRSICSYQATVGNAVVVTNSLVQLKQIIGTFQKKTPSLESAPEYTFFRDRYRRDRADETGLLVLTDATIRRWCGPRWRIADSRRTRAAAMMLDVQSHYAQDLVNNAAPNADVIPVQSVPNLQQVHISRIGASSPVYGNLSFMTPICELELDRVTRQESISYGRWRNTYQQNWRAYFDPIACRFSLKDNHIGVDLTVMPLIASTQYKQFVSISEGAALKPKGADPHPEAIGQIALAVNPESDSFKGYGRMFQNILGNLRLEPLAWVGSSLSFYADDDPFWTELAAQKTEREVSDFMQNNIGRLPLGIYIESRDPLRLAAFLTAFRAFIEQSAPNLTRWETFTHNDKAFVRIGRVENAQNMPDMSIYYAALPTSLVITLNRDVIERSIDRLSNPTTHPATAPANEWIGQNAALRISRRGIQTLEPLFRTGSAVAAQQQAWQNIPILNEWKRLFPDKDPVQIHQQLFQTRLIDPAGGTYTWNETWQTMQSQYYGHPAEPKDGPGVSDLIRRFSGEFGLTFENQGIRARVELEDHGPATGN
jgi:hypothetical protein